MNKDIKPLSDLIAQQQSAANPPPTAAPGPSGSAQPGEAPGNAAQPVAQKSLVMDTAGSMQSVDPLAQPTPPPTNEYIKSPASGAQPSEGV